jgi:hypothetical protein
MKCREIQYRKVGPHDAANCAHSCTKDKGHSEPHRCRCYPLPGSEWVDKPIAFGLFDLDMLPKINRLLQPYGLRLRKKSNRRQWGDQVQISVELFKKPHNGIHLLDQLCEKLQTLGPYRGPRTPNEANLVVESTRLRTQLEEILRANS